MVAPRAETINAIGDTLRLYANVVVGAELRAPNGSVVWKSLHPSVASVNALGEVVARAVGVALITASCDCAISADTATVQVRQVLASVTIRPEGATILPQSSEQLTATPADSNGVPIQGLTLTWQSSNPAVVTVTNGQVKGEGAGAALITAFIQDRVGWSAVTVSPRTVATISVQPAQATIAFGDTVRFRATAYDSTGAEMEGASFGWASSDTSVATVMAGLARGRAAGTTVITASAGGKTGSSSVTVLPPPVHTISVSPAQSTLYVGSATRLTATAYDVNGSPIAGTSFTWTSSAPSVARVTDGLVEALSVGSAVITASAAGVSGTASVAVQSPPPPPPPPTSNLVKAFPEAEGWGASALSTCNRTNVQVLKVTNLNDSGAGSLRDAVNRAENDRLSVIVFDVAGYITLSSRIDLWKSCLYIAGQTAPGGGIAIRAPDQTAFFLNGQPRDVVIRYLRIRPGTNQPGVNTSSNGLIVGAGVDIVLDHLSFSWANDQLLTIYRYPDRLGWGDLRRVTVQRSLFTEPFAVSPVCYSTKGEENLDGDANGIPQWYEVEHVTLHHNAAIHCSHRAPMLGSKDVEVINNVTYNWNIGATHTQSKKPYVDYIGNYFKRGPMNRPVGTTFAYEFSHQFMFNVRGGWTGSEPDGYAVISSSKVTWDGRKAPGIYLSGNIGPNNPAGSLDNWAMTSKYKNDDNYYPDSVYASVTYPTLGLMPSAVDGISLRRTTPLPPPPFPVAVQTATAAWNSLIEGGDVGANRRLDCQGNWVVNADAVDQRVLQDARNGTGPTNVTILSSQNDVGGYPPLNPGQRCTDTDGDGMPDAFETRYGLNPQSPTDAGLDPDGDAYTNLEEYLNGTAPK